MPYNLYLSAFGHRYSAFYIVKRMSKMRCMRIGILGGTFDPVHNAHLAQARDALRQLRLDLVLFIPAAQSPHKPGLRSAAARHRLAMLRLALEGQPRFWIAACDLRRPAPSYAYRTVADLKKVFGRANYFYLIGADQLPKLHTWGRYRQLMRQVTFVVFPRSHNNARPPKGVLRLPKGRKIDISATDIRNRVKNKLSIKDLVPAAVAAYIRRNRLYLR
jgi:nicotinate-nucleotide adenylyltransferase